MKMSKPTTGIPDLDRVLNGILPGDNIVWEVDTIEDYSSFVDPYCAAMRDSGRPLVYFRFASHRQLVRDDFGGAIHRLDPGEGFEQFVSEIHRIVASTGRGAAYVFDCLSELAGDWYSDQMLGNFFRLTCPFLYDYETITYFALLRNRHSDRAIRPISDTTQLLIEVLRHSDRLHIRPIKVQHRYSPTMNLLHVWNDDKFTPVTSSSTLSEIQTSIPWSGLGTPMVGPWERTLAQAESTLAEQRSGRATPEEIATQLAQMLRMIVSRHEGMLDLVGRYLTLEDVVSIGRRLIGSGLIGGKAAGMLLARAILKRTERDAASLLEAHDSFYVGSDVFYTFLVENGIWPAREKQRNAATFLEDADQARRRILTGAFPDYIVSQFEDMLDYYGQAPFIVRSSSLLEDNFGNSFAGKYESVFCANQGPRARRLEDFMAAVRTVYASTMSETALRYREQRGILEHDEQMALLIMRVSGAQHGRTFFPDIAGVGFSFNPFVWNQAIDPAAGVLRLVFGLGTRAVDRADDDYTRVVALNAPDRRPESTFEKVAQYAQRRVDYLDLDSNQLVSGHFSDLIPSCTSIPLDLFTSVDTAAAERNAERPGPHRPLVPLLTFDNLLDTTEFAPHMRRIMSSLQNAYSTPVDIEFTANFSPDRTYKINLVQCRPLQVKGPERWSNLPDVVPSSGAIIHAHGAVIGCSRVLPIHRMIYVVPAHYGQLPVRERYEIARLVGRLNRLFDPAKDSVILLGPGRWGTSTPSLGVPVAFADINRMSVLCEIVAMRDDLVPDVSLGTHFFNELVEMDMMYVAIFPEENTHIWDAKFFDESPNHLASLLPDAARWAECVRVIDPSLQRPGSSAIFRADALKQEITCTFHQKAQ